MFNIFTTQNLVDTLQQTERIELLQHTIDEKYKNNTLKFLSTDNKKFYEKNLKTQPADWYYRNNHVTYTVNSQGYRTAEFEAIDWANSIAVFGDSHVWGTGLDDSDTVTSVLQEITGINCVNLSQCSTSMQYSLANASLLKRHVTPLAAVYLWTEYNRVSYYFKKRIVHAGPWMSYNKDLNEEHYITNEYWEKYNTVDHNAQINALLIKQMAEQLWETIPQYHASIFHTTAHLLKCDLIEYLDYSRDLQHGGRQTARATAEMIKKGLKL